MACPSEHERSIMKILSFFFSILLFSYTFCLAETVQTIEWEDLIPPRTDADILVHLSEEERDHAEWIIHLRRNLSTKESERDQELYNEMLQALPKLLEKGIDVEQIVEERKLLETAVNSNLNGKQIRLAGYLLPLDLSARTIREFLLVPFVGACIHVPPPPPNQIVHAVSEKPIPYRADELFKPIWATGVIITRSLTKELYLVDGSGNVDIGYLLKVDSVEPYEDL